MDDLMVSVRRLVVVSVRRLVVKKDVNRKEKDADA
jgi:hypothetical protein